MSNLIPLTLPSPNVRLAGACYLVVIISGFFAIGYVPGVIMVHGDVAATARNLMAHELLYRLGLLVHITMLPANIIMAVILYDLFKVVNQRLSLLAALFTGAGTVIEAATLLIQFVPLILLDGKHYAGALGLAQLQAQAYLPLELQAVSFNLNIVFFAGYFFLTSYLIVKSSFLPKTLGILLFIAGLAYLIDCLATMLAPDFAAHLFPYIQLPSLVGEGAFSLWMLGAGLNTEKWQKRALAPA